MPLTRNLSLIFKSVPKGLPIPGEHLIVENRPIDIANAPPGGFITRNLYSSLDPYMRLMLVDAATTHYREPFMLDEPISSVGIGEIIASEHSDYPIGAFIRAGLPIQQYSVISQDHRSLRTAGRSSAAVKRLPDTSSSKLALAAWLGPLGMPGLTAFSSLYEIGQPQYGETILISAGCGAVGQIVGQICKLEGLNVIASAGSESKLRLMKDELGFDGVFNYKEETTTTALQRLAPDGIDIYFDNVGGKTLEDALGCMRKYGRIIICGMVSQYNATSVTNTSMSEHGVKNLFQLVAQGLTMRGFQVGHRDFGPKHAEAHESKMREWIGTGQMKVIMSAVDNIENSANAFTGMLKGKHVGKAVVHIAALKLKHNTADGAGFRLIS